MVAKYPIQFNIKLSEHDVERIRIASEKTEIPTSTLARYILRQWLAATENTIDKSPFNNEIPQNLFKSLGNFIESSDC